MDRLATLEVEFNRQLDQLLAHDYPALAGLSAADFSGVVEPLRQQLHRRSPGLTMETTRSHVPFVLVVGAALIEAAALVPLLRLPGSERPGVIDRNHGEEGLSRYQPISVVDVPTASVYLLFDVERGEEFCAVRPEDALPIILERGRTPLTIHEGIALVTQFPEVLEKNRCFMLSGSRRGDRRVPALWISDRAPKLGWCWDGNPHTWLGTASAGGRAA